MEIIYILKKFESPKIIKMPDYLIYHLLNCGYIESA
jgi:hypothetical protein